MTPTGMLTMGLVLTFVWGGFALFVVMAIRKEREKRRRDSASGG